MLRWPSLIVGAVVTAYWVRVAWMAWRSRKRAGRPANFLPRERVGFLLRFIWIPVVGLWIVLPWVDGLRRHRGGWLRPAFESPAVAWAAAGVAMAAFAATLVCWKKMGRHWRMGIDPAEKTDLLVSGPWAWVRHPIYTLSSVLMLATLATLPNAAMATVAVVHLGLLQWEAVREEKYLAATHGEQYQAYCGRVGRFIPKF